MLLQVELLSLKFEDYTFTYPKERTEQSNPRRHGVNEKDLDTGGEGNILFGILSLVII